MRHAQRVFMSAACLLITIAAHAQLTSTLVGLERDAQNAVKRYSVEALVSVHTNFLE